MRSLGIDTGVSGDGTLVRLLIGESQADGDGEYSVSDESAVTPSAKAAAALCRRSEVDREPVESPPAPVVATSAAAADPFAAATVRDLRLPTSGLVGTCHK